MTNAALRGKPDAGNPHVRFDEGEVASAATPRRGSLLYKHLLSLAICLAIGFCYAETVTISDPADFANPTPYPIGGKTVEYTGASATVQNALELSGSDGTLKVSNADTTLTWAGNVSAGKTFFTEGAGTLSFTGDTNTINQMKRTTAGTTAFIGSQALTIVNYYGAAGSLVFDNATAKVAALFSGYELAGTNPKIEIKNGAEVKNMANQDYESELNSGVLVGSSKTISGAVDVSGGSTLMHVGVGVRENSKLTVSGNSTLSFSRPLLGNNFDATSVFGDVTFNGGTLRSFDNSTQRATTMKFAQWFNGVTNLYVGSSGMTMEAPSELASLWPRLTADAGAAGAAVTKTGSGALAIRSTALPVSVQAGDLRLAVAESDADSQKLAGTATFASGTSATLTGLRSAAKMDLSSAPTVKFHAAGVEAVRGQWKRNGWATVRPDGYLQLTDSRASWGKKAVGSVFRKDKVAVDQSFYLEFSALEWNIKGGSWHDQNGGFALVFQNASAGTSAVATDSEAPTLCGYGTALQENAFALLFYFNSASPAVRKVSLAKGATITDLGTLSDGGQLSYATLDKPVRIGFSYDATAKKGRLIWTTVTRNMATPQDTYEFDLDLATVVGASSAYFGFAGASYGGWMEGVFAVGNVAFSNASTIPAVSYPGGVMTVAAGASRAFRTFGDKAHAGFLMDSLTYGDQTTLDIAPLNVVDPAGSFVGFENLAGSGTLVKRGSGNLGLVSEQAKTAALKVEAGGLVVRSEKSIPQDILDWDWVFNKGQHGYEYSALGAHGGLVIGWGKEQAYTATSRHKVDVTGSWKLSFDAYPTGMSGDSDFSAAMGYAFGVAFHDDPRGLEYVPSTGYTAGLCNNLKNAVGGMVCPHRWAGEARKFGYLAYESGKDYCYYPGYVSDPLFTDEHPVNGDVIHFEMAYHASSNTVVYVIKHNDKTPFTKSITVDLSTRIPSGKAHLILSLAGASAARMRCEYANMKFERLSAQAVTTETVLDTLTATAASVPVRLENTTNAMFRINAATLPADGALAVTAPYATAATLELGSLSSARPVLDLGTNVTVAVDAATGAETITAKGGVLRLTSKTALAETTRLVLTDDARLELDYIGAMSVRSVTRNGVKLATGRYSSENKPWIRGTGALQAGKGLTLVFR